ncbi:MAG: hypothetical protein BGO56_00490 [Sphingobacteriales bacterium 48-107]|jgi:hypothetical protein|uniref:DUF1016 N-terminal domain-containing protein n=1 Tax=uncultured Dysgonomonas sp. TaxID=206096 RepID=UPI00092BBD9F|nr:DUF1016 N-terminal domain-containing protein [uncultured Dysgonomonas sp.]OJW45690.1 MAG: hypothetical protein BGO56_00490 [Sphingobacteriales bacterium 48-107]
MDKRFEDIVSLIMQSRANAIRAVNAELINLYWNVGAYIKQKLSAAEWGDKTVEELAVFIQKNNPELKGFNRSGLYRMVQFFETYVSSQFVAAVRRQTQRIDNDENRIVAPVGTQFERKDIRNTVLVQLSWIVM